MAMSPRLPQLRTGAFAAFGALIVSSTLILASVSAADWPHWRGPDGDGISKETGWKATWPVEGPKIVWQRNVGTGYSCFSVVGDHVYTMGNESADNNMGTVFCLNTENGVTRWTHTFPSKLDPKYFDGGQLSTPTVDGDFVYILGRQGQLFCLKRSTGAPVWSKDLLKDFNGIMPTWGYSASPLIVDEKLILEVGGKGVSAMALNKLTGKTIWNAGDDLASYSTPALFNDRGAPLLAMFNGTGLFIRQVSDGKEIARYPWKTNYDINPTTPIVFGNRIFISSGYGHGGASVRLTEGSLSKMWESKEIRTKMNSCVLWQGHLYGFDESQLKCLEFASGAVKWKQTGLGMGGLTMADGKLIVLSESGDLVIAEANPVSYKELARTHVLSKTCWTCPVLADGKIYCRNSAGDIACVDVSAKP